MPKLLSQSDPFLSFGDQERPLARAIAEHTGIIPAVDTAISEDGEPYPVLRFWMRNSDGDVVARDVDLRRFKAQRERVKHALREAVRTARLDHAGAPVVELPSELFGEPTVTQAITAGYAQALEDYGIDLAGDFNSEGWYERALRRATREEK